MTLALEEPLVKSRERVKAYGEVFTPRHMVERMIDIVADDIEDVDKTVLEPSAGDGNFLVAIFERKLGAVERMVEPDLWPQESLHALASIYGIELLEDNHTEAKAAVLEAFLDFHRTHGVACHARTNLHRAANFLIDTNIVRGNTLTAQTPEGEDIQFSWWHRVEGEPGVVQREPFTLASLRDDAGFDFTVYASYLPCRIELVHQEVEA